MDLLKNNPKLARQRIERQLQLRSHRAFVGEHFNTVEDTGFRWGAHHEVICRFVDKIFTGEIKRGIINLPPGYTKTILGTIMMASRGFALNPACRFLHTSASPNVVSANSRQIKDIIAAERYQRHFPMDFKTNGDLKWSTHQGGEFFALQGKGAITGMRAGRQQAYPGQFTGAMLIDDPNMAKDADPIKSAMTGAELRAVNQRYHSVLKSRLFPASTTPVLIIQQRVHRDDLSGHLLTGGSGEKWHHLVLPVEVIPGWTYPEEWTHGIPFEHDLPPGPLWEFAHNAAQIDALRQPESIFMAQYMQQPLEGSGLIFTADHFHAWKELPNLEYRKIFVDTAQKAGEEHDWTVMQCWSRGVDGKARLIDQLRMRLEAPELERQALAFWNKHKAMDSTAMGTLRAMAIEDKVSGTSLIQNLRSKHSIPVEAIPRAKDKVMRAHDVVAAFASGLALHPDETKFPWVKGWRAEMLAFPQGVYDDQCDPTFDAVAEMCGGARSFFDSL